jgi:hypothetical protein
MAMGKIRWMGCSSAFILPERISLSPRKDVGKKRIQRVCSHVSAGLGFHDMSRVSFSAGRESGSAVLLTISRIYSMI